MINHFEWFYFLGIILFTYYSGGNGKTVSKVSFFFLSFSTVGSDHRIVSANVKLSLRVSKKTPGDPMKSIDWKKVSLDKNLSSEYTVSVYNRFQELSDSCNLDLDNIDSIYNKLIKANEEVALTTLPKKPKSKKKPTLSETNVVEAMNHLRDI